MSNQSILLLVFGVIAFVCVIVVWDAQRKARRRKSLRKETDSNGGTIFLWTDFDGAERRSHKHPEEPGGAWSSDGGSGGHGLGGDTGGGGGDGGGG